MTLPLLIEASELNQHINNPKLLVIDLSSEENYQAGHIPGAIHLAPSALLSGQAPIPNKIPTQSQLEKLCSYIGLTKESLVVVYDDQKGPWAGRLIWTLNALGHQNCSFLNGQLKSWLEAELPLETTTNTADASHYPIEFNTKLIADVSFINEHLNDSAMQVWDARSQAEFTGEKIINATKGGHIPGAQNFEWTDCLIADDNPRIKPADDLLSLLRDKGITPDKTIVTHCQTHRRSGLTYLVARYLGFTDIRCYDGSWFEWGNLADTPVEK